ncbi:MAG: hypothetical protein H6724_03680 [Sandaracinus sp.]|nr:hypothetical protein [Sandaracinus sp.]MCB9622098.1 hypothetical protein [Sandaracinus sp.]
MSGSTYVVRNAPSDIVRSRPSSAPPADPRVEGRTSEPALPPPPRMPKLGAPVEEVVERIERFDFAPVTPRSTRPPSVPPRSTPAAERAPSVPPRATSEETRRVASPSTPRAPSDQAARVSRPPSDETFRTSKVPSEPAPRARVSTPIPPRVDRVRTDLDALHSPSLAPEAPPTVDPIATLLLELCRSSPGDVERLRPRLEREAARLLPELVRHFPGPVWFDRKMPYRRLPRASESSPLGAALAMLGDVAAPHVEELLVHASPDVRFHATLVATELGRPELLAAVAQLLLDADPGVRRAALGGVDALRASPTYPHILEGLRRTASTTTVQQVWRVRSIEALGDLGDALALDVLVELLGDDDRTIARAAHDGLRRLTCHDLGSMRITWRRWAKSQGRRHRFDWLVDALADRRPELRRMALQELRRVSGHDFGLTEDAPRTSFVDAQAKFLRWWQSRST